MRTFKEANYEQEDYKVRECDIELNEYGECIDEDAELDRYIESRRVSHREEHNEYIESIEGIIY